MYLFEETGVFACLCTLIKENYLVFYKENVH